MLLLCTPVGKLELATWLRIARWKAFGSNEPRVNPGLCDILVVFSALMAVLLSMAMLYSESAYAAPDEIRVITDDIPDRGSMSWELHAASVRARRGDATQNTQLAAEYYSQGSQQAKGADEGLAKRRLALLVVDTKIRGVALSFGVGRGIGTAADGHVVKLIAGFEM